MNAVILHNIRSVENVGAMFRTYALLEKLKNEGYQIIAVEQDEKSIDYRKLKLKNENVFIMGPEVTGIPKNILKKCDFIAEIPMHGKKESLNVSVALGIVLFGV